MAASITRGTSFTSGQQNVTAAQFTVLLTSATIAGIDRENIDTTATIATHTTDPPDNPQSGEVWQDDWSEALRSLLSGSFVPGTSNLDLFTVPVGGTTVQAGMIICPEGSVDGNGVPTAKPCPDTSANRSGTIGVATAEVIAGETGQYVTRGPVRVQCTGTVNAGEPVKQSPTDGIAISAGAAGTGMGRQIIGIALGNSSGGSVWINLKAR